MKYSEIRQFIEHMKQLPTISTVAVKIIELACNEDCSIEEINRLIELDQALASKVIRIANYAYFNAGHQGQVSTVKRATDLMGLGHVRSIALSIIVVDLFNFDKSQVFNSIELWRHSTACAIASEFFAQYFSYHHPEEAFFAGLLHDLGKLVLFQWNRKRYDTVIAKAKETRTRLLELEEKHFGIGHTRVAKLLMEYWRFPSSLIAPAWLHHQPLSEFGSNRLEQLPFVVKCANSLCHINRFGDSGNPVSDFDAEELQRVTGLSADDLKKLSKKVLERVEEVSGHFNLGGCTADLYFSAISRASQELSQLQTELIAKNRKLMIQKNQMDLINKLWNSLQVPITTGRAFKKVIEFLDQSISYKRIIGFIPLVTEKVINGWLKIACKSGMERIILPLEAYSADSFRRMKTREQIFFIEQAVKRLDGKSTASNEIIKAMSSADLLVLPLKVGDHIIGQIMVEMVPSDLSEQEKTDFLHHYAWAAATALERILLIEAMDQQTEDMARIARKAEDTQKKLYHAERLASVGRLAAGVAHEINNPLAAITLKAQIIQTQIIDEKYMNDLQVIIDQTKRISKIVADLMGLARPAEPHIELAAVAKIIVRTLNFLENRFKVSGVKVLKEFEPDIPLVYADEKQLEQVFLNLTVNSLQAMKKGEDNVLTIRLGADQKKQRLRIEFSDTGVGIESQNLSKIFDPFYTSKEVGEGTGLGLAICHSIIESHYGELKVSSQPGQGTTFTILLPLNDRILKKKIQTDTTKNPQEVVKNSTSLAASVLIIEDEDVLRTALVESLSQEGYHVDIASDGVEGLIKLDQHKYDVVALDLQMPHKEGLEVLQEIKKNSIKIPVIVISGVVCENGLEAAKNAGAFAFIKKPFDVNDLLNVIRKAIHSDRNCTV